METHSAQTKGLDIFETGTERGAWREGAGGVCRVPLASRDARTGGFASRGPSQLSLENGAAHPTPLAVTRARVVTPPSNARREVLVILSLQFNMHHKGC